MSVSERRTFTSIDALVRELLDSIRRVVREEVQSVAGVATQEPESWLNTESAAKYLDTTKEGLRSAVKAGKITPFKRGHGRNARWSFTRAQLDAYARGEAA